MEGRGGAFCSVGRPSGAVLFRHDRIYDIGPGEQGGPDLERRHTNKGRSRQVWVPNLGFCWISVEGTSRSRPYWGRPERGVVP